MKRDIELIRKLLLRAEELPAGPGAMDEIIEIPGYDADVVGGHIKLLEDAGLVVAHDWTSQGRVDLRIERLTNAGHDFVATVRDDTLWNRAFADYGPKLGNLTLKVFGEVMGQLAKQWIVG